MPSAATLLTIAATALAAWWAMSLPPAAPPTGREVERAAFPGPRDRPVVLVDTPAAGWACWGWTTDAVARGLGQVVAKRSAVGTFEYHNEDKPLDSGTPAQHSTVVLSGPEFADAIHRTDPPPYTYFSADLASLPGLAADASGPEVGAFFGSASPPGLQQNLWLGQAGVAAGAHYDTSHNFYLQIKGTKRFVLCPPSRARDVGLYPFLHVAYRRGRRLAACGADTVTATLSPGETLYLPPYWFHRVEAVTESLSVNIWADSAEYQTAEELFAIAAPFEEDWPIPTLRAAAKAYVRRIVEVAENHDEEHIARTWAAWSSRYEGVYWDPSTAPQGPPALGSLDKASQDKIARRAETVAAKLLEIAQREIRRIYIGNYIEIVAFHVGGEAETRMWVEEQRVQRP